MEEETWGEITRNVFFKKIKEKDGTNKLKPINAIMNVAGHHSSIKRQEVFG